MVRRKIIPIDKAAGEAAGKVSGSGIGLNFSTGLSAFFAYTDYKDARAEGAGVLEATGTAALNFVVPEIVGIAPYIGYQLLSAGAQAAISGYENGAMKLRQMDRDNRNQTPFRGYTFVDSPQIYTMRQAGLALAQQSKYNLQQTMMGNEAKYLHR